MSATLSMGATPFSWASITSLASPSSSTRATRSRIKPLKAVKSPCLSRPPRISWMGPPKLSRAFSTESTLVPLLSLMKSTPPTWPQSSRRCSTPLKPRRPRAMASSGRPIAAPARAAAMAFSRLWGPRMPISSAGSSARSAPPALSQSWPLRKKAPWAGSAWRLKAQTWPRARSASSGV